MYRLLITLSIALITCSLSAQSGLQVYTGISSASSADSNITPEGLSHKGYHIGADGRLNSGNMYFMIGGQFHALNYLAENEGGYFSIDDKFSWIKARFGLGYSLFNFNEIVVLRAKSLLGLNFISSYPDGIVGEPYPDNTYNSGTAGVTLGLGVDVLFFTFDVEYEKGFFNAVNMVKGTEFNFINVNVGVKF